MFIFFLLNDDSKSTFFLSYYIENKKFLYSIAMQILRDPYLAEDAIQEVFLNLSKYSHTFEKIAHEKRRNYLVTMVRNQCYLMAKEESNWQSVPNKDVDMDFEGYFDVESLLLAKETTQILVRSMEKLSDAHQEIIILRYYYDKNGKEMGEALGISVSAVWMRLHRAMENFARIVREELSKDEVAETAE